MAGFLKRLFGGGGAAAAPEMEATEHNGFVIRPEPIAEGSQFRLAARIRKSGEGDDREHHLIRSDLFADRESAADMAVAKAKRMIDERGDALFS